MSLIKKYHPKKTADIVGQQNQIKALINYIKNYKKEKNKAVLLYGPTGTGKTSSAYAVANTFNYEILETNASDFRNAEQINLKVGNAIKQKSLFGKEKIILVDDIDGLSGREDRGGIQAVIKLIEESGYPIILTATGISSDNLKSLIKKCRKIEFEKLDFNSIFVILKKICDIERIKYSEDALNVLVYSSSGDARAAINDLNILSNREITIESVKELTERDRKETITAALNKIFKSTEFSTALRAFDDIEEGIDERFLWIDENLPEEYSNISDLQAAYDKLSKADVFNGRIRKWQHYRFLVYASALMSAGIAVSKEKRYGHYTEYKRSRRPLKIWIFNQKNAKRKNIALKIAPKIYESKNRTLKKLMPYFPFIFRNKKFQNKMIEEFGLDEEEVEWLNK